MKAGLLDKSIRIERSTHTVGAEGAPAFTWTPVVTLRAQLIEASTEEFQRAFGASTETATVFRTWFYPGITPADRVIYNGAVHDIIEVKEIGRRQGLEVRTKGTGEAA